MPNSRLAQALQMMMAADAEDQSGVVQDAFVTVLIDEGVITPVEDALIHFAYLDYEHDMLMLSMPHRQVVIDSFGDVSATH